MGPRKAKSERGPSGNIHHKKIRFRLELFLKSVSNIPNLESIFSSTKKIIGDYMKRKPYWKILISTFLILGMMNCSQSKDDGNEDVLLLLGIAAQNY
ncbi:LIC13354 family exoprotein, partial [Leptospira interrogans]